MRVNVIYACKEKLIGIDAILPLLMELRARYQNISIMVLFPDLYHYREVRRNYHLWKGLEEIGAKIRILRHRSAWISVMNMLRVFLSMAFRKNILLKNSDIVPNHKLFVKAVKRISRTREVYAFISNQTLETYRLFDISKKLSRTKRHEPEKPKMVEYDYYISSVDRLLIPQIHNYSVDPNRFVRIGYHRRLPRWTAFLERESAALGLKENGYFVYFLTGMGDRSGLSDPPMRVLLEETLTVLKRFSGDILAVFKPHIITDMDEFQRIINRTGFSNFKVDYGHPMVLSRKARFVMAYSFSNTLFDAFYMGKPVVLYTQYGELHSKLLGGCSEGGKACDYYVRRDPERLANVLEKLIFSSERIQRDRSFIEENFAPTDPTFWEFWEKQGLSDGKERRFGVI